MAHRTEIFIERGDLHIPKKLFCRARRKLLVLFERIKGMGVWKKYRFNRRLCKKIKQILKKKILVSVLG